MNQLRSRLKWRFYFAKARAGLHVRRTMVEGVLLLVPIVITFVILKWVWDFIDGVLRPSIETTTGVSFPGLGVAALLLLVYVAGLTWELDLGRRLLGTGQRVLMSLPIVRIVYAPARQLIQSFSGSGPSGFKRVVMIEYPRQGTWMLGFLTSITTRQRWCPHGRRLRSHRPHTKLGMGGYTSDCRGVRHAVDRSGSHDYGAIRWYRDARRDSDDRVRRAPAYAGRTPGNPAVAGLPSSGPSHFRSGTPEHARRRHTRSRLAGETSPKLDFTHKLVKV